MAASATGRAKKIEGAVQLSAPRAEALFDATARLYLGISGAEFLRKWDSGDYSGDLCTSRVVRVASLISLVREQDARENAQRRPRRIRTTRA